MGAIEDRIKELEGKYGTGSDSRGSDAATAAGKHPEDLEGYFTDLDKQYKLRGSNTPGDENGDGTDDRSPAQRDAGNSRSDWVEPTPAHAARGSSSPAGTPGTDPWASILASQSSAQTAALAASTKAQQDYTALQERMYADQQANAEAEKGRRDGLYQTLLDRTKQSTVIDPNDPNIKAQTDQFGAATTRQTRDFLADLAERKGPLANISGETRIANEHAGQAKGSLHASLMANELQNRRNEIAGAISGMQGMLTADQATGLQRELGLLGNAINQQQLGISNKGLDIQSALGNRGYDVQSQLGNRGLDLDSLKTTLLNNQFYAGLGSQNDQFAAQLGLNSADRAAYWDAIASGKIKG